MGEVLEYAAAVFGFTPCEQAISRSSLNSILAGDQRATNAPSGVAVAPTLRSLSHCEPAPDSSEGVLLAGGSLSQALAFAVSR